MSCRHQRRTTDTSTRGGTKVVTLDDGKRAVICMETITTTVSCADCGHRISRSERTSRC